MLTAPEYFLIEFKALLLALPLAFIFFCLLKYKFFDQQNKMLLIFFAGVILRIISMLSLPAFNAPDEYPHFQYIKKIINSYELPVLENQAGDSEGGWEYHQPPLYYAFSALILKITSLNTLKEVNMLLILRFISLIYYIISAILVIRILDMFTEKDLIKLICFSLYSFLPSFIFLSTAINNDSLLYFLSIAFLYYSLQEPTIERQVKLSFILALSFYTKSSAIVLVVWNFILLFSEIFYIKKNKKQKEHVFIVSTSLLLLTLILWFPWLYRNIILYKTVFPVAVASNKTVWPNIIKFLYHFFFEVSETFIAAGGKYNHIRFFPHIGIMLFLTGYISFFISPVNYYLINKRKFISILISFLINLALLLNFAYLFNQCQGRFLYIFLLPVLYGVADGLYNLSNKGRSEEYFILLFLFAYGAGSIININLLLPHLV